MPSLMLSALLCLSLIRAQGLCVPLRWAADSPVDAFGGRREIRRETSFVVSLPYALLRSFQHLSINVSDSPTKFQRLLQ